MGVDTHHIGVHAPIMVSDLRLKRVKSYKRANGPVMIDSGTFTIHDRGLSFDPPSAYVQRARRYMQEIGNVVSVSVYGRMCEPYILAKTGSTVQRNQRLTVDSYCELRDLAPDVPWLAELQGWELDDYHRCADLYERTGIDLTALPAVGVGSICRQQGTTKAQHIITSLAARGIRCHGFGVKTSGLVKNHRNFVSADSFAWSYGARKRFGLCPHGLVKWETNCPQYAADWHRRILAGLT
jgi:hypothetical protein